jgi:hypothetical protein
LAGDLKPGHYVYIEKPLDTFYKVLAKEVLDYETGKEDTAVFSSVASGASSGFKNIELLEPDSTPLHLLMVIPCFVDTQFEFYIKLPTGTNIFGVDKKKDIGFINAHKSPVYDPNPDFAFWIVKDYYPAIEAKNISAFAFTPKIIFTGMKYDIEKVEDSRIITQITEGKIPCKRIKIGGIKTSSGVL